MLATLAVLATVVTSACTPAPLMCASPSECPPKANCAAGRCVSGGATPAINTARRLVLYPTDIAYLRPRDGGALPAVALGSLGAGDGAKILLRFAAELPPQTRVLEAYLVLERAGDAEEDPAPIALHPARIAEPWAGDGVSWALQPKVVDVGAPVTRVVAGSPGLVRLDVHDLVNRWKERRRDDFGLAVLADGANATGLAFVLLPTAAPADPARKLAGPILELYVK